MTVCVLGDLALHGNPTHFISKPCFFHHVDYFCILFHHMNTHVLGCTPYCVALKKYALDK